MTDQILLARLRPALAQLRLYRTLKGCAMGLAVAALLAMALLPSAKSLAGAPNDIYAHVRVLLLPAGLLLGILGAIAGRFPAPRAIDVAKKLEQQYPDLEGRLVTALQQVPGENGRYRFLQEHLFCETLHHSTIRNWKTVLKSSALNGVKTALGVSLAAFICLWAMLPKPASASWRGHSFAGSDSLPLTVTPGDTELEKGSNLVLLAHFGNQVPAAADLVVGESSASAKKIPLTRSMSDPMFGGTVAGVTAPLTYRVVWDGGSSPDYKVRVFEYPKLERSDVTLTYPEYTKLPAKHIEDMRHTSAVEGTRIDLDLLLNKPVATAILEPRKSKASKEGETAPEPLKLETAPDKPSASLPGFVPAKTVRYDLVLTDTEGRQSRQKVPFSFEVIPNKLPELKLTSPKGDQKPSALQELLFTGTVWDDFGVVASGLEVTTPGGNTVYLPFSKDVPGRETRNFQQLLRLEELNAVPDQLFAWHVWADDLGPDGKLRRTRGDLFYGEIRAFEEIFRQGDGMENSQQQQQQQQQGQNQGGGPAAQLAEVQKQIINATWKLQRSLPHVSTTLTTDIETVRDSQKEALSQANEAAAKAGDDPVSVSGWKVVVQQMDMSLQRLDKAVAAPAELSTAVTPAQSAYQALLKLRAHEYDVSRKNRQQQQSGQSGGRQGGNEGTQRQQEQLDQLDLAKQEDRYETQREAQAQQSAERREQMQVMNRLKELAQRQQDVNEKLKELQTSLNEAKSEKEKEEIRRRLKRLEEEQRQMLADADELGQRMEQRSNQSEAGQQREQLDQARQDMEQAADATAKGEAGQALASGTRAQEQMQQMREEMRQQSADAFSEELRQMRAEAREIARKQEDIAKQMSPDKPSAADTPASKAARKEVPSLGGGSDDEKVSKALEEQEQRTGDLVKRATELSEQAEPSEPTLSRQIYEAARQYAQDDTGAVKQTQQEMLKEGSLSESEFDEMRRLQESEQSGKTLRLAQQMLKRDQNAEAARTSDRAREGLDRLRQGVEKAAESVIGDDTEAIRQAESQLQAAAGAVQKEIERQQQNGGAPPGDKSQEAQQGKGGQATAQNRQDQPRSGSPEGQQEDQPPQNAPENQPGQAGGQTAQNQNPQNGGPRQNGSKQQAQAGGGRGQQQSDNPQEGQEEQPRENSELAQQESNSQPQEGQQPGGQQPQSAQQGQRGQGARRGGENQPGGNREGAQVAENRNPANTRQRRAQNTNGGGGGGGPQRDFETRRPRGSVDAPLTGNGFTNWSDNLREAEEMVDQPELRNGIASARERARQMRFDMRRDDLKKPDWAVVQLEILKPLVEVRDRLREELARRDSDKSLVPVDRDPVPAQFSENVRRYYEQLGRDQ